MTAPHPFEGRTGGPIEGDMRHKSHLLFAWLAELVRCRSILDAVEDLHGPDLLCWTTNFFIKEAADPAFVSWHQDSTYWGLSKPDVVTAWVAFTEATEANGAMEYIPGSHKLDQIPRDTFAKHNLLTRGQEVMVEIDHSRRDHHPASGRDVIAPRAPRSRLATQPVGRPAHRLCHPLYPDRIIEVAFIFGMCYFVKL